MTRIVYRNKTNDLLICISNVVWDNLDVQTLLHYLTYPTLKLGSYSLNQF